jgi:hypothetical protein
MKIILKEEKEVLKLVTTIYCKIILLKTQSRNNQFHILITNKKKKTRHLQDTREE